MWQCDTYECVLHEVAATLTSTHSDVHPSHPVHIANVYVDAQATCFCTCPVYTYRSILNIAT